MLIMSLPKLGHRLHYSHTKLNIIWLVGKTQRKPKIQKSHYDVANSKPAMMRHYLQSPLLHDNTLQNLKIIFHKAQILIWHLFLQSPNSYLASIFYKARILIWHLFLQSPNSNVALFLQSPNTNLALFYKAQILFWQFFHKAQILIWQLSLQYFYKSPNANLASILQKPKTILAIILQSPK